ncbi:MAG: MerR family transcriptional regulator, partial [Bacillota bacterium]|nr:MerR family transcriptional regulator [Bacillota bacterium]
MMMTVNEVSKLTGISVRTLHYYDEIGLLHPASVLDTGYRLYDDENLKRLQQIMLFRELEFPLKEIKKIIDNPDFDTARALENQIELLSLRREHLDNLIQHAKEMQKKEESKMDFKAFDKSKLEEYSKRAKEQWGDTAAYKEYEEKAKDRTDREEKEMGEGLMQIFTEFGKILDRDPAGAEAQALVKKLRDYISSN